MSKFAEPMTRLIDELKKPPGVGSKRAAAGLHILRLRRRCRGPATAVRDV
jgi:recombinational DNA repair protein RecR